MSARKSPGANQGLDLRQVERSTADTAHSSAIAFLQASIAEQREREQHGLRCPCDRCRAVRAMALAESGAKPSLAEIDSDDPVVLRLLSSGPKRFAASARASSSSQRRGTSSSYGEAGRYGSKTYDEPA